MYVGLGSNLSVGGLSPPAVLTAAMDALQTAGLSVTARSAIYRTIAVPAGPDFANAAIAIDPTGKTPDTPAGVLMILHRIEAVFNRERDLRWSARTLDLDLLAAGQKVTPDAATQTAWRELPAERQRIEAPDRLILPHPRLQDRAFVLVPLAEIAPEWRHPLTGFSVREMLAALPATDRDAIRPWKAENPA